MEISQPLWALIPMFDTFSMKKFLLSPNKNYVLLQFMYIATSIVVHILREVWLCLPYKHSLGNLKQILDLSLKKKEAWWGMESPKLGKVWSNNR